MRRASPVRRAGPVKGLKCLFGRFQPGLPGSISGAVCMRRASPVRRAGPVKGLKCLIGRFQPGLPG